MSAAALSHVLDMLAAEAPAEVARGRLALGKVLAWTCDCAWGEVAWSFSDLAGGAPVELVWRPGQRGLFWTAEPAAPEWPAARRTGRALALARAAGARFGTADRALIRAGAASSAAPWPVWIGGRHDAAGDSCKLYLRSDAVSAPLLRGDDRPVMLGLSADGGREIYWRRPARLPGDCWRMSREPGLAPMVRQLDAALREWTGHGLDAEQAGSLGLSLKHDAGGKVEAVAAFLHVRHASDADRLRRRLIAAGGHRDPAMARLWTDGWLRPLGLSLAASAAGVRPALGFRLVAGHIPATPSIVGPPLSRHQGLPRKDRPADPVRSHSRALPDR